MSGSAAPAVSADAGQTSDTPATQPAAVEPGAAAPAPVTPEVATDQTTSTLGGAAADEAPKPGEQGPGEATAVPGELEIKVPEGANYSDEFIAEFKTLATELELDSDKANRLVGFQAKMDAAGNDAKIQAEEARDVQWTADLAADPKFGGEKLDQTKIEARSALRQFGGPDLAEELHKHGLGEHPGLIKAFASIRQAIAEDSGEGGGNAKNTGPLTEEQKHNNMYNHPTSVASRGGG